MEEGESVANDMNEKMGIKNGNCLMKKKMRTEELKREKSGKQERRWLMW